MIIKIIILRNYNHNNGNNDNNNNNNNVKYDNNYVSFFYIDSWFDNVCSV